MSKRIFLCVAIAVVLTVPQLIPQTAPSATPAPPPSVGKIQGIVVREGTTNPIAGVTVSVNVPTGNRGANNGAAPANTVDPFTTKTDSSGRFSFDGVLAGTRAVTAQLDGYFGRQQNGTVTAVDRTAVTVVSEKTAEVKMELIPAGVISGRIYDSDGMPVSDSHVQSLRLAYQEGRPVLQVTGSKSSDDRGEYRIYRLPPGEYFIAALPRNAGARGNGTTALSLKTFYPDVTDPARAVQLTIRGGDEISGTNISIRTEKGATLSGTISTLLPASGQITGPRGQVRDYSAMFSTLTLTPHDKNGLTDFNNTSNVSMLAPNLGKFQIRNVPPGVYDLLASFPDPTGFGSQAPPGVATQPMGYGRTSVQVSGGEVDGIGLTIHAGVDIKGRITVNGGSENAQNVRVQLQPDDSASRLAVYQQVGLFQPVVDVNGNFTFPSVPEGRYKIQVTYADGPVDPGGQVARGARGNRGARGTAVAAPIARPLTPANAYIENIRQGTVSVYDNGLTVGAQSAGELDVTIRTGPGTIQGTLVGVDQKPAQTTVFLVPAANRRQNFALYKTTGADANGKFAFNEVAPGEYQIFAWQEVINGAYQNEDYIRKYDGRGTIVSVPHAATIVAQARVIPSEKK